MPVQDAEQRWAETAAFAADTPLGSSEGPSEGLLWTERTPTLPRSIYYCVFGLLFLCYAYVHQDYTGGTSTSRLDLLQALIRHGTVTIDRYHQNTSDKALFGGHYYSDKAPGTFLLALPGFALGQLLVQFEGGAEDTEVGWWRGDWLVPSWFATAGSAGLITALGGVFFFSWLCRWIDVRLALITTLGLFLGAAPFPYATMLFSHGMAAGLVAIALWAIGPLGAPSQPVGRIAWLDGAVVAGGACGLVLASEFTAGIVVVGIWALVAASGWRSALRFCVAAVPSLLLIPAYSWVCFGTPFTLGYSHQATFPAMKEGLYGIQWPNANVLLKLLFSPDRGLLFWSPFFVMALVGFPELFRRSRGYFWLALLVPIIHTVVISGEAWDWRAGWTLGPRYLSPMLPLVALPAGLGTQRCPWLGTALCVLSILLTGLGTVVNATPRYEITNPLTELHLPALAKGELTYNLGKLAGLPGEWSFVPLLAMAGVYLRVLYRDLKSPLTR